MENVKSTNESAVDLYNALRNWYILKNDTDKCDFTKYQGNDLHIFGESFAGHWIPGIGY